MTRCIVAAMEVRLPGGEVGTALHIRATDDAGADARRYLENGAGFVVEFSDVPSIDSLTGRLRARLPLMSHPLAVQLYVPVATLGSAPGEA